MNSKNKFRICILVPTSGTRGLSRILSSLFPDSILHAVDSGPPDSTETDPRSPWPDEGRWRTEFAKASDAEALAGVFARMAIEADTLPDFDRLIAARGIQERVLELGRAGARAQQRVQEFRDLYEDMLRFSRTEIPEADLYNCFLEGPHLLSILRLHHKTDANFILHMADPSAAGTETQGQIETETIHAALTEAALARAASVWLWERPEDPEPAPWSSERILMLPAWMSGLEVAPPPRPTQQTSTNRVLAAEREAISDGETEEEFLRIGVWGRIEPENDLLTLLTALGQVLGNRKDFTLSFYGSPSNKPRYWEECQILAESLCIGDALRWKSGSFATRYQMPEDIVICPGKSQLEGIFRAWDQGSLVLAADSAVHREVLSYESRFLYRRQHPAHLALRLERLILESPSLDELRHANRERRAELYSAEAVESYFSQIYAKLTRSRHEAAASQASAQAQAPGQPG